jgi:hypothetical protein
MFSFLSTPICEGTIDKLRDIISYLITQNGLRCYYKYDAHNIILQLDHSSQPNEANSWGGED